MMRRKAEEQNNRLIKKPELSVVFFIKTFQKMNYSEFCKVMIINSGFLKCKLTNYLFSNLFSILILVLVSNSKGFNLTIFL